MKGSKNAPPRGKMHAPDFTSGIKTPAAGSHFGKERARPAPPKQGNCHEKK